MIGIDWGTTSLRAYLLAPDGRVLDRRESADGILAAAGRFADVLAEILASWPDGAASPVLMSGMIGSRQGWVEAPYVGCPADAGAVAAALYRIDAGGRREVHIVPGLSTFDGDGIPDVIRGEETQVLGALTMLGRRSGQIVLPGTHSKWVRVEDGCITGFSTYMTGEVFAALKGHTILGRTMEGDAIDPAGFARGVELAREDAGPPGRLLHRIFSARTLGLFDRLDPRETAGYLSGLLVGAEIVAASQSVAARGAMRGGSAGIVIVASPALAAVYADAARRLGYEVEIAPADCVTAGHLAIARAASLVQANEAGLRICGSSEEV